MKNLMIAVLFLVLSGCAGAALEDEMKERGYSEQEPFPEMDFLEVTGV